MKFENYEDKELLVVNKEPNYLTIATDKEKYKTLLSQYNTLLLDNHFITIERKRDCKGHSRNIYRVNI